MAEALVEAVAADPVSGLPLLLARISDEGGRTVRR
jgi:hypothetical protein